MRHHGDDVIIKRFKEVDSTNEEVFRIKDKVPIPFFVLADRQSMGRGRFGRSWASPEGGLWMTGIFKKRNENDGFKFMFGSCVVTKRVLNGIGVNVRIKFPNDIYFKDKKLCGILVEERDNLIAVGIGLNVNQKTPPVENSTTLFIITGREHNINVLAYNIAKGLMEVERKSFREVFGEYYNNLDTIGKNVKVFTGGGIVEGVFVDIGEDLNVILRGESLTVVYAWEIFHIEENYERGYESCKGY